MAYVYRHIRLDKNVPFYIGIGSDLQYKRAFEKSRRSIFWNKIINKTLYSVEILFDNITNEFAKEKEKEFIKIYGRIDKKTGVLCNLTDGGDGINGYIFTKEHKEKLSISAKKRILSESQKEKLRGCRIGKKFTAEQKLKLKDARKGIKLSDEHKLLISNRMKIKNPSLNLKREKGINFKGYIEAFIDNKKIGIYAGIMDASEKLNVSASKISAVLNNKRNHTGGYFFKRIHNGKVL